MLVDQADMRAGGEGGIRTPTAPEGLTVFKTVAGTRTLSAYLSHRTTNACRAILSQRQDRKQPSLNFSQM